MLHWFVTSNVLLQMIRYWIFFLMRDQYCKKEYSNIQYKGSWKTSSNNATTAKTTRKLLAKYNHSYSSITKDGSITNRICEYS